ncbi:MAG: hypothetical protein ACI976_002434, partial [Aureispira sp.]
TEKPSCIKLIISLLILWGRKSYLADNQLNTI